MSLFDRKPPTSFRESSQTDNNSDDVFKPQRDTRLTQSLTDAYVNVKFRHFARRYILNHLRKKGFDTLADKHEVSFSDDEEEISQRMLHHLAGNLAEEREHQFEDILVRLNLTSDNLSETYRVIVNEMFVSGVNWGRILAFMVFSGSLAVYCAREDMEGRVGDVIKWTEDDVEKTVSQWVEKQGGWRAFVDHFDDGSWTIDSPQCILAGLLIVLVGGFYLLRKLF